jgi:MtrB/PioB family decaheme-associated outer membrane protein
MKKHKKNNGRRILLIAVQSALATLLVNPLLVQAQTAGDDEAAALKRPSNEIDIGVLQTSAASAKFGEYNGLNKSRIYGVGNLSIRGGDAYDGGDGTLRWGIKGSDLGTTSRDLQADVANQGQWKLGVHYDELRHAITDTYQTPFIGTMGDSVFTLPGNFGIINTTAITGSTNPLVGSRNLNADQLSAFHTEDVGTTRKNSSLLGSYQFDRQWSIQFDYNRLDQSGAKLIAGSSSDARTGSTAAGTWAREAMVILMNPTNYNTNTFNLGLNWIGDKGYASGSYFGSIFSDAVDSLSWSNPMGTGSNATGATTTTLAGGYQPNMLSTAPSNNFHQANLNGGYTFGPTTRINGGVSYGRNTQNSPYLVDLMQAGGLPQTSLNALVVTKNANVKLSDQSIKNLSLSAGLKLNERDNRTPSSVYQMFDIGGGPAAAANSGTRRLEINTPYSMRKAEADAGADYRLNKTQHLIVSLGFEDLKRWCNNVAGAAAPDPAIVGKIAGNVASPAGANCVIVPASQERKMGLNYRLKASDDIQFNAGYQIAKRTTTTDYNALTPLNDAAGANNTGIVNASNYAGFNAFFDAARVQEQLKASLNWQAAEALNVSLNVRRSRERYTDSPLGVQDGSSFSSNLDATYSYSEDGMVAAYYSAQGRNRSMKSGASGLGATDNATSYAALVAPVNVWLNQLNDRDRTLGINGKQKGLMGGKLDLVGDFSVTYGKTYYHTEVPYFVPTATAPTCDNATSLSCGDTPEMTSKTRLVRITGIYMLDKHSKISLGYQYQKQETNDAFYNVYQYGFSSSTLLSTNQQAPNYGLSVVSAVYIYTF